MEEIWKLTVDFPLVLSRDMTKFLSNNFGFV